MAQVTGTVTRPVECRDQFGNVVANSFCDPALQPASTQVQICSTTPVGSTNTYSWMNGTW